MHFTNTITPGLRVQIPDELVEFLKLKPGDKVNLQYQGFSATRPTMDWTGLVDERHQVYIPDKILQTHGIKAGYNISLWHDNPDIIYIKPGITWKDLNSDNIISRFQYEKLTIDIRRETQHNGTVDYSVKLYGTDNISWEHKLTHCEKYDAEINLDKLKDLAIHLMLEQARAEVDKQARFLNSLRSIAILLENLHTA